MGSGDYVNGLEILGEGMENSRRRVIILKVHKAYKGYRDMLHHYAVKNITDFLRSNPLLPFTEMCDTLAGERVVSWANVGGQLMPEISVDRLRADISAGRLESWGDIHDRYDQLWDEYKLLKQKHAFATLCSIYDIEDLTPEIWHDALSKAAGIQQYICDQVYLSRKKDYENPFRIMIYRNEDEMKSVMGDIDENDFIRLVREETKEYTGILKKLRLLS
jgi:hypothetical protein